MKNLGTASVTSFEVGSKDDFSYIRKVFGNYIFNRISDDGKFFVKATKEQLKIIDKMGVILKPISA